MGERILAVCDRCKLKVKDDDATAFLRFLRDHQGHNFTGCRVVREDNPCPNRERDYQEAASDGT